MKSIISIIFLFIVSTYSIIGQVKRTNLIGAYVYNFAKLSKVCNQDRFETYNIFLISNSPGMITEFERIRDEMSINDKKIKLTISQDANINYEQACLIFVSEGKKDLFKKVYEKSQECRSLLVTENYPNKEYIMLNLYDTSDNKILFEMNKGNIYGRGINISDEILLMGGSIVDLAKLYINSQEKLKLSSSKLVEVEKSIKTISEELSINQDKIKEQIKDLADQDKLIAKQKSEYNHISAQIVSYRDQIDSTQKAYIDSEHSLKILNDKLNSSSDSLLKTTSKLHDYKNLIDQNNTILADQQGQIKDNKLILSQKIRIIKWQRWIVLFFVIGTAITITLLIIVFRSFTDKKKKNKLLKEQKKELANQYKTLKKNKNLIESMMDELGETNEELTTMLEDNKRMQNELIHSEKMASLGVLSAGIAHEINNPINFVHAGINSLLRDFEDIEPVINEVSNLDVNSPDLKEKIEKIKVLKEENYFDDAIEAIPHIIGDIKLGADRTAEIVKGLRNFTRLDRETLEPLQINEGIDTSLLLLKNKTKNRIEIIKDYADDLPNLICFPGKINQAFLNIMANAVDAIKDEGTIWLSTHLKDNEIIISIKDSGCGIPEDVQQKIFDPFFTTKTVGNGTGLGLSITYGIISEHNGNIDLISKENMGTEFIITLPLK